MPSSIPATRSRPSWIQFASAQSPIRGRPSLQLDIDNFKSALREVKVTEGFLPVAAPASVIPDRKNEYYKNADELQQAIGDAMRTEYKMIIDAGLLVQLDDARAAVSYDRMVPPKTLKDYRTWLAKQVEIINYAIKGLPRDKIRYHICWGSWPGPHSTDVAFGDIADLVLKVRAGAYSIEAANPRHEHEWTVWEKRKLPADTVLIPGVISHATNIVEHPELVSQRIVRLAHLVGRENVIASTDCGFAAGHLFRAGPSADHVGEARVAGPGRSARQQAALAAGESTPAGGQAQGRKTPSGEEAPPDGARPGSDHSAVGLPAMNSLATSFAPCALRSRWPAPGKRTNFFGALIIA